MRKTVPMQPDNMKKAWLEIARIAAEKLKSCDAYAPPTKEVWLAWAAEKWVALPDSFPYTPRNLTVFDEINDESVPGECRVVSLMQNEGE